MGKHTPKIPTTIDDIESSQYGFLFHYYRAEVYRETNWRNRLDTTTNWAIIVTAALLSYAFSSPDSSHAIVLLNYLAVLFFLHMESRRFRFYFLLKTRVRLMEQYLIAEILEKITPFGSFSWRSKLAASLRFPKIGMSRIESLAWRIRRNYIFLIGVVIVAWISKLTSGAFPPASFAELVDRAQFGFIPGIVLFPAVILSGVLFYLIGFYVTYRSLVDDLP